MQLDLEAIIGKLLFEFDAVIIPGFGGFVANYKSSTIDHVQGMIHPPSKSISFNENLVVNDGILVNHLKSKHGLSLEEAKDTIQQFVVELKKKIEEREIIVFPEVGRLYRDYENKLQFLPDNSNYNLDAYGLSPVQYYPILRNKDTALAEAPVPKSTTKRKPAKVVTARKRKRVSQSALLYALFGVALIFIAYSSYVFFGNRTTDKQAQTLPVENRLNTKPGQSETGSEAEDSFGTEIVTNNDETEEEESIASNAIEEDSESAEELDTESITLAPNQKECIVIIGGFRSKENVQKLIERLYDKGYDAYQDKKGDITRVGAQFIYETESQKRDKIKFIRDRFEPKAWELK